MMNHFNHENIVMLGYTVLCSAINIQALIERMSRKYEKEILPPSEIKLNISFLLISFIAIMFIRGFIFLFAIFILKSLFLKLVALILLCTDLLLTYGWGFNAGAEGKPVTKTEYTFRTVHLILEVCFILFFFVFSLCQIDF